MGLTAYFKYHVLYVAVQCLKSTCYAFVLVHLLCVGVCSTCYWPVAVPCHVNVRAHFHLGWNFISLSVWIFLVLFDLLTCCLSALPPSPGFIPPPLIFGMGIDSTCLFWSSVCGEKGACMLYDNVAYRHLYVSIAIVLKSSAFLLYTTTWQCLRKNYRKYIKNSEGYLTPTELFASNVTLDNLGKEITQNPANRTKFIYNLEDHEMCNNMESVL